MLDWVPMKEKTPGDPGVDSQEDEYHDADEYEEGVDHPVQSCYTTRSQ